MRMMARNRLPVTVFIRQDDDGRDKALRPETFDEFVGQRDPVGI